MMIEERLEVIESLLRSLVEQSKENASTAKLDAIMETVVSQKTIKDFYSTAEVADMVGRSEFQVRQWCREGRVKAIKRACGRGSHKSWMVSHEEVDRYRNHGLRPS